MKCNDCCEEIGNGDTHDYDVCHDTLMAQRDETVRKLDSVGYELMAVEKALMKAVEALRWYADPKNNGPRKFVEGTGADATCSEQQYRPVDEDEGEVAREVLAVIEATEREVLAAQEKRRCADCDWTFGCFNGNAPCRKKPL